MTCGADVHQRASGRFFLPEDQKKRRNDVTDYNGQSCNFSPSPAAAAAASADDDDYCYYCDDNAVFDLL